MKRGIAYFLGTVVALASTAVYLAPASVQADEMAAADFRVKLPPGYRDWKVISVAHEAGKNNDLRAVLGNDAALKAYRDGNFPLPDGAIIARLAWVYTSSEENNKVFGQDQSFVAGPPINVQFMVKDSKKYTATGGWGFAQFKDGKLDPKALLDTCFPCHIPAKDRDYLFTRYSP